MTTPLPSENRHDVYDLEHYAKSRCLQPEWLEQKFSLHNGEIEGGDLDGRPSVVIPYIDEKGNITAQKYRFADRGDQARWRSSVKDGPHVYGLHHLQQRNGSTVFACLSEEDVHAALAHDLVALSIPATLGRNIKALARVITADPQFTEVIVIHSTDASCWGFTLARQLRRKGWTGQTRVIKAEELTGGLCKLHERCYGKAGEFESAIKESVARAELVDTFDDAAR